jgi:hypothetical protein
MLYVLIGLVLIFSGIVFYGLWLFRWRGTRIGDIPVLLDALIKYSRRPLTLVGPDETRWVKFMLYSKDGQEGIRVLVPCAALDDAHIRRLTAALGRGKRPYSVDHNKILHADFGTSTGSINKFARTVLIGVFHFPETARFQLRPDGSQSR